MLPTSVSVEPLLVAVTRASQTRLPKVSTTETARPGTDWVLQLGDRQLDEERVTRTVRYSRLRRTVRP